MSIDEGMHAQPASGARYGRLTVAVLSVLALLFPLVSLLANKGVVVLLLLAALASCIAVKRESGRWPRPDRTFAGLLGLLLAWQLVASIWAIAPLGAAELALRLAVLYVAGLMLLAVAAGLDRADWDAVLRAAGLGFALAVVVMALEFFDGRFLYAAIHGSAAKYRSLINLNGGVTCVAIMALPVARWLRARGRTRSGIVVPIFLFAFLVPFWSESAEMGLACGILATLICLWRPRWSKALVAAVVLGGLIGSPFVAKALYETRLAKDPSVHMSVYDRINMWNFAVDRFLERPVGGWGFDSSRDMPNDDRPLWIEGQKRMLNLHPHNAWLQVALELGIVGMVIVGALLFALVGRLPVASAPESAAFAAGSMITVLAIASSGYGIWQNWWVASLFILAFLVRGASRSAREAPI
ncbi:MAG TPA: O-antigen ligase family protein [Kiloniellales bacterium]|nr:O-antigen ligase family protein [Kiloniellales bacterium]